ncbi:hypothetical protein ACK12G_29395 [Mycolicibacterium wolinskyi]|uniref:hypothetical protein n=1 Tax=Mycolicibacterium wolinskyi TaxID=59750 RepID=UPI003917962F
MRKISATLPSITPPPGADFVCEWETHKEGVYRAVFGPDRTVTDHPARVYPGAVQLADGTIEDIDVSSPCVYVSNGESESLPGLNSDQARELAAALLECAAQLDGWVQR